ncbi:MAG TPA: ATP-binding cassette domain-containing protein [Synergistaceae bacterium]|nr:ATP-binding cassette domain-containing protein [Synergistaceae bacterium]HPQ36762.1 ATP-binding cassette domain-containing protein [Synergistaceae bacterium]
MKNDVVCSFSGLSFEYPGSDTPALSDVSLTVRRGEWISLVGANGSGKSTLAKMMNALLIPTQGHSYVCGYDSRLSENHRPIREKVAMVFQNPENQIVAVTVEEDVAFGPENLGLPEEKLRERVAWAIQSAGLEGLERHPTYGLSGGQKQRLAVAGALALGPLCLVLDEATSMVDPQGRKDLMEIFRRLHEEENMAVVNITHRLEEIWDSERIVVLEKGKILWEGTPLEFLRASRKAWDLQDTPMMELLSGLQSSEILGENILPLPGKVAEALCP